MREITIRPVLNGFIVSVGCTTVVKECAFDVLQVELRRYHDNPNMVEREYQSTAVNRDDKEVERPTEKEKTQTIGPINLVDEIVY
jgi:hypothetical protein